MIGSVLMDNVGNVSSQLDWGIWSKKKKFQILQNKFKSQLSWLFSKTKILCVRVWILKKVIKDARTTYKIDKIVFNRNHWPWGTILIPIFSPFDPEIKGHNSREGLNVSEFLEKSLGTSEPLNRFDQSRFNPNHRPWVTTFDVRYQFQPIFRRKMKIHGSREGAKCTGIFRKVFRAVDFFNTIKSIDTPMKIVENWTQAGPHRGT